MKYPCHKCRKVEDARTRLGGVCHECVASGKWLAFVVSRVVAW